MPEKPKQTEYGALWIKTGPKGEYLNGTLTINGEKVQVVAFKNDSKKNPAEPDWRILQSKPREENTAQAQEQKMQNEGIQAEDLPF